MSMDNIKNAERTIQISDDVLRQVAAISAKDVADTAGLDPHSSNPVRITNLGGAIAVEMKIIVRSGSRAAAVAQRVQMKVKQSIQDMTGVTAVHVHVEVSGMTED